MPIDEVFEYFKKFHKTKELNRSIIVNLVDRIIVNGNHNINLVFNFNDIFKDHIKGIAEFRQQIKTFRLKYFYLAGKITKTARYVIINLSENYSYKEVYENCQV